MFTAHKIVVEDELLSFLAVKIKILSQDEIVLLAANTFGSKWIESSECCLNFVLLHSGVFPIKGHRKTLTT